VTWVGPMRKQELDHIPEPLLHRGVEGSSAIITRPHHRCAVSLLCVDYWIGLVWGAGGRGGTRAMVAMRGCKEESSVAILED